MNARWTWGQDLQILCCCSQKQHMSVVTLTSCCYLGKWRVVSLNNLTWASSASYSYAPLMQITTWWVMTMQTTYTNTETHMQELLTYTLEKWATSHANDCVNANLLSHKNKICMKSWQGPLLRCAIMRPTEDQRISVNKGQHLWTVLCVVYLCIITFMELHSFASTMIVN